jgi:hypothetical protein
MRTVLAVTALLLTAGCLGATTPGNSGPAPTSADGFPPGVTEDGLQNATELLDAHDAELADTGYEFRLAMTTDRAENATYTGRALNDEFRIHMDRQRDDSSLTVDTWANDSVVLTRLEHGSETRFDQRRRYDSVTEPWNEQIERILDAGDFEVTDRYVGAGQTFLVLDANEARSARSDAYQAFSARAVVDLDGRVHELNATTVVDSQSESWTRTVDFELTTIGVESIDSPGWSERALATVDASVGLDSNREFIELEHQAGDPLPEGTTVELSHDDETHTLTFDQSLDPGERAYLAYPADGSSPVLTFEEPSGEFERIEGAYEVSVTGPDGTSILNAGFAVETGSAEAPDS